MRHFIVCCVCFWPGLVFGQIGGERSFEFINLPSNARTAALGGTTVSSTENRVENFLTNPALLDSVESGSIAFSYLGFLAGIGLSNLSYAQQIKNAGVFGFGLQYMSFGSIEGFDAAGFEEGSFNANEFAFAVGYSHRVSAFALGGNIKIASSGIESYRATAMLFDLGGLFEHPTQDLAIGLNFKNIGFYVSDYTRTTNGDLPFDVQLGLTFKPRYMPVRFSIAAYNLYRGDLTFLNPESDIVLVNQSAGTFDKVFRHFNIGAEFLISKNIHLRTGYNHLIRKELRIDSKSGGAGFSFGLLARIKRFELAYTRAIYHVAGGGNHITIGTNLNTIIKKKSKV